MNLINLTPHDLNINLPSGDVRVIPPSGEIARVTSSREVTGEVDGVPVGTVEYGEVTGLPSPEEGKVFIVSGLVRARVPDRKDVLSPGPLLRDGAGCPDGCPTQTEAGLCSRHGSPVGCQGLDGN